MVTSSYHVINITESLSLKSILVMTVHLQLEITNRITANF